MAQRSLSSHQDMEGDLRRQLNDVFGEFDDFAGLVGGQKQLFGVIPTSGVMRGLTPYSVNRLPSDVVLPSASLCLQEMKNVPPLIPPLEVNRIEMENTGCASEASSSHSHTNDDENYNRRRKRKRNQNEDDGDGLTKKKENTEDTKMMRDLFDDDDDKDDEKGDWRGRGNNMPRQGIRLMIMNMQVEPLIPPINTLMKNEEDDEIDECERRINENDEVDRRVKRDEQRRDKSDDEEESRGMKDEERKNTRHDDSKGRTVDEDEYNDREWKMDDEEEGDNDIMRYEVDHTRKRKDFEREEANLQKKLDMERSTAEEKIRIEKQMRHVEEERKKEPDNIRKEEEMRKKDVEEKRRKESDERKKKEDEEEDRIRRSRKREEDLDNVRRRRNDDDKDRKVKEDDVKVRREKMKKGSLPLDTLSHSKLEALKDKEDSRIVKIDNALSNYKDERSASLPLWSERRRKNGSKECENKRKYAEKVKKEESSARSSPVSSKNSSRVATPIPSLFIPSTSTHHIGGSSPSSDAHLSFPQSSSYCLAAKFEPVSTPLLEQMDSEGYTNYAKEQKHKGDDSHDRVVRFLHYMESSVYFSLSVSSCHPDKSSDRELSMAGCVLKDTVDLIKHALILIEKEGDNHLLRRAKVLCLRSQSVLNYHMYFVRSNKFPRRAETIASLESQVQEVPRDGTKKDENRGKMSGEAGDKNLSVSSQSSNMVTMPMSLWKMKSSQVLTYSHLEWSHILWNDSIKLIRWNEKHYWSTIDNLILKSFEWGCPLHVGSSLLHLSHFILTAVHWMRSEYEAEQIR